MCTPQGDRGHGYRPRGIAHEAWRRAPRSTGWRLIDIEVAPNQREGRYLLRSNLCGQDPAQLWQFYIQLVEIEATFKTMKDDLNLRPIYHKCEQRIEAHIFVAFQDVADRRRTSLGTKSGFAAFEMTAATR